MSSEYGSSPFYTRRVFDCSIPSSLFSPPFTGISLLCPVRCQPSKTIARTSTAVSGAIESVASLSLSSIVVLMLLQKIEHPLSNLIAEIAIPPPLAETILDTDIREPWLVAVPEFEQKLDSLKCARACQSFSCTLRGSRRPSYSCMYCIILASSSLISCLGSNQNSRILPNVVPTDPEQHEY